MASGVLAVMLDLFTTGLGGSEMMLETVAVFAKRGGKKKKKPNVDKLVNTNMSGDLLMARLSSELVSGLPAALL